jgi:hypothetical protein
LCDHRSDGKAIFRGKGVPSPAAKPIIIGIAFLLAAWLLWEARDLVPSWAAHSVTANIDLATTTEPDDSRVIRAFERARQSVGADASLQPLPNQTKVRHARVSVRAPSSAEALARATAMAEAMKAAFSRDGEGTLSVDVRRRTVPVADASTAFLGDALRIGAAAAGIFGLALILLGWLRGRGGPDRLPNELWWAGGAGLALTLAPLFLPGDVDVADHRGNPHSDRRPDPAKAAELRDAAAGLDTRPHRQVTAARVRQRHAGGDAGHECSRYRIRIPPRRSNRSRHPDRDRR